MCEAVNSEEFQKKAHESRGSQTRLFLPWKGKATAPPSLLTGLVLGSTHYERSGGLTKQIKFAPLLSLNSIIL